MDVCGIRHETGNTDQDNARLGYINLEGGPAQPQYVTEQSRLATFFSWPPGLSQRPKEMAKAGFYYVGRSDQVKCFSCNGGLESWQPEDDVLAEHKKWFPTCVFLQLQQDSSPHGQPVASRPGYINLEGGPAEPQYVTEHSRLQTFSSWPPGLSQRPEEMAQAGFYYVGRSDQVKCFYCNGGLQSWQPDDDVVAEHRKWFPTCVFLQLQHEPPGNGESVVSEHVHTLKSEDMENIESKNGAKSMDQDPPHEVKRQNLDSKEQSELSNSTTVKPEKKVMEENLVREVEELRRQRSCKICLGNEVGVVFLPCSHLVSCSMCATAVKNCPLCRSPIQQVVRTYLS